MANVSIVKHDALLQTLIDQIFSEYPANLRPQQILLNSLKCSGDTFVIPAYEDWGQEELRFHIIEMHEAIIETLQTTE